MFDRWQGKDSRLDSPTELTLRAAFDEECVRPISSRRVIGAATGGGRHQARSRVTAFSFSAVMMQSPERAVKGGNAFCYSWARWGQAVDSFRDHCYPWLQGENWGRCSLDTTVAWRAKEPPFNAYAVPRGRLPQRCAVTALRWLTSVDATGCLDRLLRYYGISLGREHHFSISCRWLSLPLSVIA